MVLSTILQRNMYKDNCSVLKTKQIVFRLFSHLLKCFIIIKITCALSSPKNLWSQFTRGIIHPITWVKRIDQVHTYTHTYTHILWHHPKPTVMVSAQKYNSYWETNILLKKYFLCVYPTFLFLKITYFTVKNEIKWSILEKMKASVHPTCRN